MTILRKIGILILLVSPALSWAQDRSKLSVFVAPPTGGTGAERNYFLEQFRMELIGANYPSVETKEESAYTLYLSISDNESFDPKFKVDDANKPFILGIRLTNSKTNDDVVSFNFAFINIDQMAEWNLYLLYQALANAYVSDDDATEEPAPILERWRNQLLYLNAGLGVDTGFYLTPIQRIDKAYIFVTGLVGLEYHFLSFLSAELDIKTRAFDDGETYTIALAGVPLLKGMFKLSSLMLEPYVGAEVTPGFLKFGRLEKIPFLSLTGGVQFGFKGGEKSAWILDFGVTLPLLGSVEMPNKSTFSVLHVYFTIGYKFGFIDRRSTKPADKPAATPADQAAN